MLQVSPLHRFLIDAQGTVRENLYHNYAGVGYYLRTALTPPGFALLRNFGPQSPGMSGDHKDHQEHQQDVNQRDDVRIRDNTALAASRHAHESPRLGAHLPRGGLAQPAKKAMARLPAWR